MSEKCDRKTCGDCFWYKESSVVAEFFIVHKYSGYCEAQPSVDSTDQSFMNVYGEWVGRVSSPSLVSSFGRICDRFRAKEFSIVKKEK